MESNCISDEKFSGDPLGEGRVSFVDLKSDRLECYDLQELYEIFFKQEKLYYWNAVLHSPLLNRRIYKLSYTGKWIDQTTYDLVFSSGYDAIALYARETVAVGSAFGISRTHGALETIYSGIPVKKMDLKGENLKVMRDVLSEVLAVERPNSNFVPMPVEIYEEPGSPTPVPSDDEDREEEDVTENWVERVLARKSILISNSPAEGFDLQAESIRELDTILDADFTDEQIATMEEIHVFNVRILDAPLDANKWKGLKRIILDNCSLGTMSNFDGFLNLESLILMSNNIKDIPALQSLPKLKLLDLQNNYLTSLKGLENCKLPSLESLEVGLNLIEEIGEEVDIFPVLAEIDCSNQRTDTGNVKNSTVGFEKEENLEHGYQEILFHRL